MRNDLPFGVAGQSAAERELLQNCTLQPVFGNSLERPNQRNRQQPRGETVSVAMVILHRTSFLYDSSRRSLVYREKFGGVIVKHF